LQDGEHSVAIAFAAAEGRGTRIDLSVDGRVATQMMVDISVVGRGDAYVGQAGMAPLVENGAMAETCDCKIDFVRIEKTR
jgi:hypothetical protein